MHFKYCSKICEPAECDAELLKLGLHADSVTDKTALKTITGWMFEFVHGMVGENPTTQKVFMEALSAPTTPCCAQRGCGKNNRVGEWLLLFIIGDEYHSARDGNGKIPQACTTWETFAKQMFDYMVEVGNIDPATLPGYNGNERPVPHDHDGLPEYVGEVAVRDWLAKQTPFELWTGEGEVYHKKVLEKIRTKMMDSMKQDAVSSHQ
jgi:hypothetical protein